MEGSWGRTWGAPKSTKCTKTVTISWQSKLFWICPKWLKWSFSGLDGHLKGDMSQIKSWRGLGVAHEVNQNAPKWTKMDQNGHHGMFQICPEWLIWSFSWFPGHLRGNRIQNKGLWGCTWGAQKGTKISQYGPKSSPDNWGKICYFNVMQCNCDHFCGILVHLTSNPMPFYYLIGLLSPFKCPSSPEKDYISHSGQFWNNLLCHAMVTILVHLYPFWCILVHLICNPMTPPWLLLTTIPFQVSM